MPSAYRLAVLADLRNAAGITLDEMARQCGLTGRKGRDSASAWEIGHSVPHPRRRAKFIDYLGNTLGLRHNPTRFQQVWEILIEEWQWQELEQEEWEQHFDGDASSDSTAVQSNGILSVSSTKHSATRWGVSFPHALPPGSRMPFSRNPLFVGRVSELRAIADALRSEGVAAISQGGIAATAGLGGIGKTQLAVEFVHRYGQLFSGGVFWLNFAQADAVPAEVAACGGEGHLALRTHFNNLPLDTQVRLVMEAWSSPQPRLLIFDNCEDPALFEHWRPRQGGCRILLTSRRTQWDSRLGVNMLLLSVLSRRASVTLLRKHCPDVPAHDPGLTAIAAELGDLPLALHLAGSFLARYSDTLTPREYIQQLRGLPEERSRSILQHPSLVNGNGSPTDHVQHVARTFAFSYNQLDPANPIDYLARSLLARAAFFAPGEAISRDLLIASLHISDDYVKLIHHSEEALGRILALGLLETAHRSDTGAIAALRMHRLLVVFVQQMQQDDSAQRAVAEVLYMKTHQSNESGAMRELMALHVHLRVVTDAALKQNDARAADLAYELSLYLHQEDSAAAYFYNQRSIAIRTLLFGEEHLSIVPNLHHEGWMVDSQGDPTNALLYHQRGLAIRRNMLGDVHPDTAVSFNYVGTALHAQSRYADALYHYEKALFIREQAFGAEHAITAQSLNNLGLLLNAQGQYATSLAYLERARTIREHVLSADNPVLLITLNNLGYTLRALGRYTEARSILERVLAYREHVYGPENIYIAVTLNHLGRLHYYLCDYARAHLYLERALLMREQDFGEYHYDTGNSRGNIGMLLFDQGDNAGALPYLEQAVSIHEKVCGEYHRHTARSLNHLGLLAHAEHDYAEALCYLKRALHIREQVLGYSHPDSANSRGNIGMVLLDQGDVHRARGYLETALAAHLSILSEAHPYTARSLDRVGLLYQRQGDRRKAGVYFERAVTLYKQILGDAHPHTAICEIHRRSV